MAKKSDAFDEVEKGLQYKYGDKERERSNRASGLADLARGLSRSCPLRHDKVAWTGPPHDAVQAWVCLDCKAVCCEPEVVDRGYDFATVPDWIVEEILDLDLKRQSTMGNPASFGMSH